MSAIASYDVANNICQALSDGSEDEDVLQDFKLSSFVSMLTGTRKIAVALTPAKGRALSAQP